MSSTTDTILDSVQLDESKHQANLVGVLDQVRATVAPVWPLQDYVAVNPYQGLADQNFLDARSQLRSVSDCEMLMPLDYYRTRFGEGEFLPSDIQVALGEIVDEGIPGAETLSLPRLVEWLHGGPESGPDSILSRSCWSFSREFDLNSDSRWTDVISEELSKVCSAHYDLGQATWSSPWKSESLFVAWRERNQIDLRMELKGLDGFRKFVASLPADANEALLKLLMEVGVPETHWHSYLLTIAYETPGWSAFTRYQSEQAAKQGKSCDDFIGLLAMRLAYDCAIAKTYEVKVDWLDRLHSPEPMPPASDELTLDPNGGLVRYALLRANEIGYRRRFLAGITTAQSNDPADEANKDSARKLAQLVFCIDVRSERIRRNLEATTNDIDTFGFAGFFGLPMEYVRLGESQGSNQLPVLVDPVMKVHEGVRCRTKTTPHVDAERIAEKASIRSFRKLWNNLQKSAVSCFTFVESAGLIYALKLAAGLLGYTANADNKFDAINPHEKSLTGPTLAGLDEQGYTVEKLADMAQGILRNLGLTKDFARIVAFCGHASQVENNPMQSGLDCGACAGHSGESNARFAAMLLNDPQVRNALHERGLEVPSEVHFLGGLHNTTTDSIEFFDLDLVPGSHREDLAELSSYVKQAGASNREERANTLDSPHGEQLVKRSQDWSEVRPEWGLTGNAAFVIGPRQLTSESNLAGRSFMHSYDEANDPEGKILEQIMTAPMIVTNWINMQYFASTVDQKHFGCGNKTIHNVVGKFGLLEGNGGDLRAGLAWQSLHNGTNYVHDPVRLLVVVAAKRESIDRVIAAHKNVRDLVANGWVQLVAVDDGQFYRCSSSLIWKQVQSTESQSTESMMLAS